ncbi:MAG: hypothetical protein J6575_03435 [Bifidobacterium sp.]|nr:hypothetical protein [Bifidobacterium sp.]
MSVQTVIAGPVGGTVDMASGYYATAQAIGLGRHAMIYLDRPTGRTVSNEEWARVATLPEAMRPAYSHTASVDTDGGLLLSVTVDPGGDVTVNPRQPGETVPQMIQYEYPLD